MTYFRVWNDARLPINVAITWGGVIQHYKNDIPAGGYWEWDVPGLGWHAMTGVVSTGSNGFDPAKDNVAAFAEWIVGGAGVVMTIAGIALIPFSMGASTPLVVLGIAAAVGGGVVTATDIVIAGVEAHLYPASVSNLYGPDGYNTHFTGAEVIGTYDKGTKKFTVTQTRPLKLEWHNNNTGAHGVEFANR